MGRKPKKQAEGGASGKASKRTAKVEYLQAKQTTIGQTVRKHRKQMRLTAEDLAKHLGLSISYIGLLERGDRCPSLYIMCKLCDLYGITAHELLTGEPERQNAEQDETELDRAIIALLRTLSEHQKGYIINSINGLRQISG
ncbi:MAG: helix-turn-helix domain-containing protein [Defluviitaleaceae bacterium]|nr:helix-turn-helix domain-containing protein [Defluviitaleaceae bacterium]MCL2836916.1 helix-turn-helix domain-containing protein [Defluviitaleaceae bacterium]